LLASKILVDDALKSVSRALARNEPLAACGKIRKGLSWSSVSNSICLMLEDYFSAAPWSKHCWTASGD
jgi:hypothetical protein